jgi:hypothetical protein
LHFQKNGGQSGHLGRSISARRGAARMCRVRDGGSVDAPKSSTGRFLLRKILRWAWRPPLKHSFYSLLNLPGVQKTKASCTPK